MHLKHYATAASVAALLVFSAVAHAEDPVGLPGTPSGAKPAAAAKPAPGLQVLHAGPTRGNIPPGRTAGLPGLPARGPTTTVPGHPGIQGLGGQRPALVGNPRMGDQRLAGGQRMARGPIPMHNFGGHPFHGRLAWEAGTWHHEMHNGRMGYWWDVGGAWYFYPHYVEGPPSFVSEVEVMDDPNITYASAPAYAPGPDDGYGPGYAQPPGPPPGPAMVDNGYPPPPGAYPPPPEGPPPGPNAATGALGGAITGGLLGGLISGRPTGALVGAAVGAGTGAIVGDQIAQRRMAYFMDAGHCYYRYPDGRSMLVDFRYCR